MRIIASVGVALAMTSGVITATACSAPATGVTADSPIFRGVDKAAVEETLNQPGLVEQYDKISDETIRDRMTQARAYDYLACRAAYETYRSWVTTGKPGELARLTPPTEKVTDGYRTIEAEHNKRLELIKANDAEGFRNTLLGEANCGHEIPVKPGDYSGQKIDAAISALPQP